MESGIPALLASTLVESFDVVRLLNMVVRKFNVICVNEWIDADIAMINKVILFITL
jgi:hypothetical protein